MGHFVDGLFENRQTGGVDQSRLFEHRVDDFAHIERVYNTTQFSGLFGYQIDEQIFDDRSRSGRHIGVFDSFGVSARRGVRLSDH